MPLNVINTSLKLFASHCILFLFTFYTAALVLLVTGCSLCVNNPTRSHMCIYFDSHNLSLKFPQQRGGGGPRYESVEEGPERSAQRRPAGHVYPATAEVHCLGEVDNESGKRIKEQPVSTMLIENYLESLYLFLMDALIL